MLNLHVESFDLSVTRDLWILVVTGICAVLLTIHRRRKR